MMFALEPEVTGCVSIEFGAFTDIAVFVGLIAIPAVSIPLIARIARQHPSRELTQLGRRRWGVRLRRWGLLLVAAGILGFAAAIWIGITATGSCEASPSGLIGFLSAVSGVIGVLIAGGGWALAIRAVWVVFATVATIDVWIFYISVLIGLEDPNAIAGLLLLAFPIHAACMALATRWSFVARNLGPIERAKAGEAGRTLSAVWIFLASYTALALFRNEEDIFSTAAGSAVIGALTLGALAATMGSGFTKYAEAINATPPTPPSAAPTTPPATPLRAGLSSAEPTATPTEPATVNRATVEPSASTGIGTVDDDVAGTADRD